MKPEGERAPAARRRSCTMAERAVGSFATSMAWETGRSTSLGRPAQALHINASMAAVHARDREPADQRRERTVKVGIGCEGARAWSDVSGCKLIACIPCRPVSDTCALWSERIGPGLPLLPQNLSRPV